MSMFGDDEHHDRMNDLYDNIEDFLKDHTLAEFMYVVYYVLENNDK